MLAVLIVIKMSEKHCSKIFLIFNIIAVPLKILVLNYNEYFLQKELKAKECYLLNFRENNVTPQI